MITNCIDEQIEYAADVSNYCIWCEEQSIRHDLQTHLDTHEDNESIFGNLE